MPSLDEHHSTEFAKILYLGDSGSGKTGSLVSLVKAGFTLMIADYDNGLDSLRHQVMAQCPEQVKNVHFVTLTDKLKGTGNRVVPDGLPQAFVKGSRLAEKFEDLGDPGEFGPTGFFIIDSLTFMGHAALRYVLYSQGRAGSQAQIQDWGEAMRMCEDMLALLYSDSFKCNVLITSHITYQESEGGGVVRGLPTALGSKLPPKVGRYFNTTILAKTTGSGTAARKRINTVGESLVELKNPAPTKVPATLDLNTGLAEIVNLIRS